MAPDLSPDTDAETLTAARAFAPEDRARSARHVAVTALMLVAAEGVLLSGLPVWIRAGASVLAALTIVRAFVLFHDVMHGSILRRSRVGRAAFSAFGLLILTPPRVWRDTHNYHHAHTAKIVGSNVGSFVTVTTAMWSGMSMRQRLGYRAARHPLTIALGYFTVFAYGMCLSPLLRAPRKNWTAAVALAVQVALGVVVVTTLGWLSYVLAVLGPLALAMALGGYLFYAQHNFPEAHVQPRHEWRYVRAALESSSYLEMGPILRFFTGNIGYHHVHHLNPAIPFYRLPEAMASVPGLRSPRRTSLALTDVRACLRLKLWDPVAGRLVGYPGR